MNGAARQRPVPAPQPSRRVVLLGASNLTKGIGTVLATAESLWSEPLEVLTALGHGRSYGRPTQILGRELPGIRQCGLWTELGRASDLPTVALVTDIGNDLLYEEPLERIVDWVEGCFDQLANRGTPTVVTALPLGNLARLGPGRFYFFRTIFFPPSRLSFQKLLEVAAELDSRVRRLAVERKFVVVEQSPSWYGLDPIHITLRHRPRAWNTILGNWQGEPDERRPSGRLVGRTLYLCTRRPHERRFFGLHQRRAQPTAHYANGTTVSFY